MGVHLWHVPCIFLPHLSTPTSFILKRSPVTRRNFTTDAAQTSDLFFGISEYLGSSGYLCISLKAGCLDLQSANHLTQLWLLTVGITCPSHQAGGCPVLATSCDLCHIRRILQRGESPLADVCPLG